MIRPLVSVVQLSKALGGYGERMNRPAEGVHDRIFAKALVLFDGQQLLAIIGNAFLGNKH